MFGAYRSYLLPTVLAVGLHAVLGYLVAGSWFEGDRQHRVQPFRHVKAELVDLSSQTKAKEEAEKARQKAEQKRKEEARQQAQERQRKKEQVAAEKKRKAEAERKKQAAAERKKKAEAEKQRQQDLARKRKAEEKAKADAKAKKEAELARKREAEAKAKRERQEQARRQEELERIEREAAAELARVEAAQREAEEATARRAAERELVASAVSVIRDGVQRNWRRPPSARNGMRVGVRIHLLPTGEVDDAYVVKSSGDDAFDRSAVNAVLKAERFPELRGLDPVLFDRNLRQINLEFRPEDLRL